MNFKTWSLKTILIGLVVVSIIGVLLYKKATVPVEEFKYLEVVTGKLVQKVGVTGKVKPVDTANLTFEQNGKIQNVFVKVGDHVNAGNTLVKLTNEELWAQKTEALANLQKAEAQLQEVQNGTRKETIDIEEDQLDVKKTALETAKNDLLLAIEGVYPKAQYIIKSVIANLTENPSYKDAKLTFKTPHTIELNDLNNQKFYLYEMLKDWEKDFPMMTRDNEELHENATKAFLNLQQLKKFIDDLVEITPTLSSRFASTQAKVTAWAAVASATQTSVGTLITTVVDAKDALSAAERNLSVSKRELIYAESGSSDEQVAIYEASVLAAKAQVQQVQAKINKTILYAPFSGVITKVNSKPGEVISLLSAKEIMISMIGDELEIEVNVPEIDISKIKIGDSVEIQFDAFEDQVFESKVKFIEPAETEVQGVVYYQVKVELNLADIPIKIRSGMSVEVDIITAQKEGVIKVPQRMVIRQDGEKIIRVLKPYEKSFDVVEVAVKTGLRDDEGYIEILEGLEEGDKLLLQ